MYSEPELLEGWCPSDNPAHWRGLKYILCSRIVGQDAKVLKQDLFDVLALLGGR